MTIDRSDKPPSADTPKPPQPPDRWQELQEKVNELSKHRSETTEHIEPRRPGGEGLQGGDAAGTITLKPVDSALVAERMQASLADRQAEEHAAAQKSQDGAGLVEQVGYIAQRAADSPVTDALPDRAAQAIEAVAFASDYVDYMRAGTELAVDKAKEAFAETVPRAEVVDERGAPVDAGAPLSPEEKSEWLGEATASGALGDVRVVEPGSGPPERR